MSQFALIIGSVYALIGVLFGAFGAHALSTRLSADVQAVWQTAVQYQFYHALALIGIGLLIRQGLASITLSAAAIAMTLGVLIFSGSLYALALSGLRWLGAITPFGGVLLIVGWSALLVAVARA